MNQDRNPNGFRHNEEVKKFAVSLHYFSTAAYEYVRSVFALPSVRSISNWTSPVNCEPGFFIDVFNQIQPKMDDNPEYQDCALLCDAIAIKSSTIFSKENGCFDGFINYGENIIVDDENIIVDDENIIVDDENIIVDDENIIVDDENIIVDDENIIVDDENIIVDDENIIVDDENIIVDGENIIVDDENIIVDDENIIVNDENIIVDDENIIVDDENIIVDDENIIVDDENIIEDGENKVATEALVFMKILMGHSPSMVMIIKFIIFWM